MRFAFCLFRYFPYGGLQRDFLAFAGEAQRRGHEVRVYCMCWEGDRPPGLEIVELGVRGLTNHTRIRHFEKRLAMALKSTNVDLVVGFNKMPGLDMYFAADTCFAHRAREERGWFYRHTPRARQFLRDEEAVFDRHASTHILLISPNERDKYIRHYQTPEQRLFMLPPGVNRERFALTDKETIQAGLREEFDICKDEFLLVFVGSDFRTKGLDRALAALAALPVVLKKRARLLVIGQGKERRYRNQAQKAGLDRQVNFLGGRNDVARFMSGADCLLHPARSEAAGIVLVEALVAGLPVIVTDLCGYAPHIAAADAGQLLPAPFQQVDLDRALEKMLRNPEQLQAWRRAAHTYAATEDLYSMHSTGVDRMEGLARDKTQA